MDFRRYSNRISVRFSSSDVSLNYYSMGILVQLEKVGYGNNMYKNCCRRNTNTYGLIVIYLIVIQSRKFVYAHVRSNR